MNSPYFLVCANFLAAIGGGIILNAGLDHSTDGCLKGSVLSFFVGAVIGLFLSSVISKNLTVSIARWFSIIVAITSLILYGIVKYWGVDDTLHGQPENFFFALLSVRFGLWFFSRALRAQTVGTEEKQGVALIESAYYSGAALGLLAWAHPKYPLSIALLIDASLQGVAGFFDLLGHKNPDPAVPEVNNETHAVLKFDYARYRKLTIAVVCLTVGFQAVWFTVAETQKELGSYVLPCFYIGVGLSALICKGLKIKFDWESIERSGKAVITSEFKRITLKPSFGLISTLSALGMVIALLGLEWWHWSTPVLFLTITTAFIYQILVLSLLDRIGREEKSAKLSRMITQTYLIVAVTTLVSIGLLKCGIRSYVVWGIVTMACCLISYLAVRRNSGAQNYKPA